MYNTLKLVQCVQCEQFHHISRNIPISINVLSKNNIDPYEHYMLCNIMQYIVYKISKYCCQYCLQYYSILFLILFVILLNTVCNFVCRISNDIVDTAQIERVSIIAHISAYICKI